MVGNGNVVRRSTGDSFFLIEPSAREVQSEQTAKTLAQCKGVVKVFLTSGAYGFVVHARSRGTQEALGRACRAKLKCVQGHFVYARSKSR